MRSWAILLLMVMAVARARAYSPGPGSSSPRDRLDAAPAAAHGAWWHGGNGHGSWNPTGRPKDIGLAGKPCV